MESQTIVADHGLAAVLPHSTVLPYPISSARCPTCGEWRGTLPARSRPACGVCGQKLREWQDLGRAMQPMEWQRVTLQGAPVPALSHDVGRGIPAAVHRARGRRKRYCVHGHDVTVVGRYKNGVCCACAEETRQRLREASLERKKEKLREYHAKRRAAGIKVKRRTKYDARPPGSRR